MNPPANWYEDPTGRHGQRYWDGDQWTEHVFTDGVQGVDPLDAGSEDAGSDGAGADDAASDHVEADTATSPEADTSASTASTGAGDGVAAVDEEPKVDEQQEPTASHVAAGDSDEATGGFDATRDGESWAGDDGGDATPAPLPQRGAHARPSGEQSADAPVDGLFDDTDVPDTSPAMEPAGAMWTPDEAPATADADHDADADDADVAPEVQAEDVVASLDEVSDSDGDQGEEGSGFRPSPAGDLSDAFVLAPETASRLVGRRQAAQVDQADDADEAEDAVGAEEEWSPEVAEDAPSTAEEPTDDGLGTAPSGAIDAPPPSMPASDHSATDGGLGITGDLVSGAFAERADGGPVALQNSRLLRCAVADDAGVIARQGTMVAYQGEVSFERQGAGGVTRALKRAATGEGLAMMRVEGTGDVFFADGAQHVFLLHLDGGPGLSVNGRNVLAFSASLQWDIERVKGATLLAGGLFNTTLTGSGWVALVSDGEPVVLRTDEAPTLVDVNALVAWSAGLSTRIVNSVSAKSLVGLGSGEAFQMAFDGTGVVVVQPSEGPTGGATAS